MEASCCLCFEPFGNSSDGRPSAAEYCRFTVDPERLRICVAPAVKFHTHVFFGNDVQGAIAFGRYLHGAFSVRSLRCRLFASSGP